ncbi:Restriction endonuclease [Limosilactobacillus reuteri subsp. porcinus]|uniref:Restriction endonuclease n=1 Tax=Limosilactobacillus reuteri TaxID=1598 RepID=A0A0U5JNT4_LIMRT|nr:Restriction endonuclease [Limosilactobacillus reuteri subsp. porcinus]
MIAQLMKFDPSKFESFSRLLISKMGVVIDKDREIVRSGDHGIDGFGYFTSYEFRTSRVAIQCKRYTKGAVSEPEIDNFKSVFSYILEPVLTALMLNMGYLSQLIISQIVLEKRQPKEIIL